MLGGVAQTALLMFGGGVVMGLIMFKTPIGPWITKIAGPFAGEAVAVVSLLLAGLVLVFNLPFAALAASALVGAATLSTFLALPKYLAKIGVGLSISPSGTVQIQMAKG